MKTLFAALALLCLVAPARAQDTMIVLDGSGSMWGRVDGRTKIEIAREALGGLTRALPAGTRLGLMAYGHRRAGDCADIETLIPAGPLDPAAFAAAAGRVTPRGRTPISASLQRAAETGARRIVLLSDGIETCVPDACADIRALRARGVDVTVHVIGFDIGGAAQQAALACIAEATGGRFLPARNAADLARALADLTGAAAAPAPPPAPPAPPPAATETNLTLEAADIEGGPRVAANWRLIALTDPPREVLTSPLTFVTARVPPGDYEVRVTAGVVRLAERFRVSGAEQTHRVVLGIGTVPATARLAAGGAVTAGRWDVLADEVSGYEPGETVTGSASTQPTFRLPQGSYRVRFRSGVIEQAADIVVEAGRTTPLVFELGAGRIRAASEPGRPPVSWAVRRPDGDRPVLSVATTTADFLLPAGDYVLLMRVGGEVVERAVTVRAGQVQDVRVPRP
jgi:Ca-activated chloride channel family protein